MNSRFEPRDGVAIQRLIDEYPLGLLVSGRLHASPLPLLAEMSPDGEIAALFGHCARDNSLVEDFTRDPAGLIVFQGPHGYVSPALVSKPDWGPTWNYAVLRFRVSVAFVPEETEASVARLASSLEGDRWPLSRLGPRADAMMRHIIAFRATVTGTDHVFKLGQNESVAAHAEIVEGHADRTLASWMETYGKP
jgi:transcriptional regulator